MNKYFVGVLSVLAVGQVADAESTSCYRFTMQDSVERSAIPTLSTQTWCYKSVSSPVGSTLIYNADQSSVRPELSALLDADGIVTHGSLSKGVVTIHRVNARDLNPLPVPLSEPAQLAPIAAQSHDVSDALSKFQSSRAEVPNMTIQEGTFEGWVLPEHLPWRGFWWSYKSNALAGSNNSPLAKYDRYVNARTGVTPRVASWERTYHKFKDIAWEGHCNGWAASAVLRPEPNTSRFHQQSGIVFSVSDQKGILAEEDYCATVAFYGSRNYGKASNDPKDIYPAEFHTVLHYYVGQLRKVVAMDYMSTRSVDNHLVSGITSIITPKNADTFNVITTLTVHRYDANHSKPPGVAPTYIRTYKYTLKVDGEGNLIGGSWISGNPDFLWVPLSPVDCSSNNPRMSQQFTSEILNLPPIQR